MSDEVQTDDLPQETVGSILKRAREASGQSLEELAAQSRIPARSLSAIEAGNYPALPGRTYTVGFARTYARMLGLDEKDIVARISGELAVNDPAPVRQTQTFEPGDPARVPGSRFAWLAALAALIVLGAGLVIWRSNYMPGGSLPSLLPPPPAVETPVAPAVPTTQATPAPSGPVVLTATADKIWLRLIDAAGAVLVQKDLYRGESVTVPDGEVRLRTARPDALDITIGGQPVSRLAETQQLIRDVPVTAAALLARGTTTAEAAPPANAPRARSSTHTVQRENRRARAPDTTSLTPQASPSLPSASATPSAPAPASERPVATPT